MVLLQQVHHSVEVAHILADHECEVTGMDLLVIDNIVTDLVPSPLRISEISENVLDSCEHSHRHSTDVLKRDQVSLLLLTVLEDVRVVVGPDLEAVFSQVLCIV